jgi:protein-disulfide isomerase
MESQESQKFTFTLNVPVAILIAAVMVTGAILYIGRGSGGTAAIAPTQQPSPTPIKDPTTLLGPNDPSLGNANAKVTIVEFTDFECPYCRSFFIGAYPQLKKDYIDTGKARLVFRNFPLPFHDAAKPAALAALCANDQGKFWQMHDEIFTEQQKQEPTMTQVTKTISFTPADLKTWAAKIGLDMQQFNQCVSSNKYTKQIDADTAAGTGFSVDGTPTFFINGQVLVGAQPFSAFKTLIDAALK